MKNFDEFMESMLSKDWSLVAESIAKQINGPVSEADLKASILLNATILKEYHNWLNDD